MPAPPHTPLLTFREDLPWRMGSCHPESSISGHTAELPLRSVCLSLLHLDLATSPVVFSGLWKEVAHVTLGAKTLRNGCAFSMLSPLSLHGSD